MPSPGTCLELDFSMFYGKQWVFKQEAVNTELVVSDRHLLSFSWFQYRLIKLDLITVGKFCFNFSRAHGSVVDCVNVHPSARVAVKPYLA